MRTILCTGKDGGGTISDAAVTAAKAAASGKRVPIICTDPAHSLPNMFNEPVGVKPMEIALGLYAREIDQGAVRGVDEFAPLDGRPACG